MDIKKWMLFLVASAIGLIAIYNFCYKKNRNNEVLHRNSNPKFNFKGDQILISLNYPKKNKGQLYLLDLSGKVIANLTRDNQNNSNPSFSNDGKEIVYIVDNYEKGSSVWILNTKGLYKEKIIENGLMNCNPQFSSDNEMIVFQTAKRLRDWHMGGKVWDDWGLFVLNRSTKELLTLTQNKYRGVSPVFFDNNKSILFMAADPRGLYKLNLLSKKNTLLFKDDKLQNFKLSSNSSRILYDQWSIEDPKGWTLCSFDLKTNQKDILYSTSNYVADSAISQDEKKALILVIKDPSKMDNIELFLIDLVSKKIRKIEPEWGD